MLSVKKIFSVGANTILIAVLVSTAALYVAPRFGTRLPFEVKIVRSGSMEPAILTGSVVAIEVKRGATYRLGDVITFGADTRAAVPTTHRIIGMREEGGTTLYTTKGDANEDPDPSETPANEVIGKVVFTLPYAGYILAFAKTPLGFALMIVAPAALIMLNELLNVYRELAGLAKRKRALKELQKIADGDPDEEPEKPREDHLTPPPGRHFDIETHPMHRV